MNLLVQFLAIISAAACVCAVLFFAVSIPNAVSAIQEATIGVWAVGIAVIPYVFMRSFESIAAANQRMRPAATGPPNKAQPIEKCPLCGGGRFKAHKSWCNGPRVCDLCEGEGGNHTRWCSRREDIQQSKRESLLEEAKAAGFKPPDDWKGYRD